MDITQALESLILGLVTWLGDATYLAYGSALILLLVAVTKQLPFVRDRIWAGYLPIIFQAVFWVVVQFLKSRGILEMDISSTVEQIYSILSAITNVILGTAIDHQAYKWMARKAVPFLGTEQQGKAQPRYVTNHQKYRKVIQEGRESAPDVATAAFAAAARVYTSEAQKSMISAQEPSITPRSDVLSPDWKPPTIGNIQG